MWMKTSSSTQAIKFVKVFILFIVALIICDYLLGNWLEYNYKNQKNGMFFRANYAIDSTRARFLVVGSSRANHNYDPHVFEKRLKISFYNCGRDAQGIIYSTAVLSAIIGRYRPEFIIIDVLPDEFTTSEVGKLGFLLPYHKRPVFRKYINYNGDFEEFKLWCGIYPYNSQLGALMLGRMNLNDRHNDEYQGYLPLHGDLTGEPRKVMEEKTAEINTAKYTVFKELLLELENRGIRSVVVMSPSYGKYVAGPTVRTCRQLTAGLKLSCFLNLSNTDDFNDPALFKDDYHLNHLGAEKFSEKIAELINAAR